MNRGSLRVKFIALWSVLSLAKIALAARLPLFVDEAFYAWESRHPAWAYSDLPGMTAWLIGLGRAMAGGQVLAVRALFLVIGAALPWLVVRIAARWFGTEAGWRAGLWALLMPLAGLTGVLAMPDVPLLLAALLCLDGIAQLRERVSVAGWLALTVGLVVGGFSHYRFAIVVLAGLLGLVCDARSRRLLRDARLWLALAVGALAWLPLLLWNLDHAGAGWRFQVLERNPWSWHLSALTWLPIQALVVTPLLFVFALLAGVGLQRRRREDPDGPWGLLFGIGLVSVAGYFVLGFFADAERVSFHWPLAGWLVLVIALAGLDRPHTRGWAVATNAVAGLGLASVLVWLMAASVPAWRERLATTGFYPQDFAGIAPVVDALRKKSLPADARIVADNFEIAAQLAFALDRADILVLDHPHNHRHGRAAQLAQWRVQWNAADRVSGPPTWLVVDDGAVAMKKRLQAYHALCAQMGGLTAADVIEFDRGRQRYLLFAPPASASRTEQHCITPALAWIDAPTGKQVLRSSFAVSGWAFKDGAGIDRVVITLDGQPVADADYGRAMPQVAGYWKISTDPQQPRVGFDAVVDASALPAGKHRLGLVLYGKNGSVEVWPAQTIRIAAGADRP